MQVDFEFLYTALFCAAAVCIIFWLGLLLAGLAGEMIGDDAVSVETADQIIDIQRVMK